MSDSIKTNVSEIAAELGLTLTSEYVPWSKSTQAKEKDKRDYPARSFHWRVTLAIGTRSMTTDYSMGSAHCEVKIHGAPPSRGVPSRIMVCNEAACIALFERGEFKDTVFNPCKGDIIAARASAPDMCDVLHCLIMDSDALNHESFADWAAEYGYDDDSVKARGVYDACISAALKLRALLGESNIERLRVELADY
jgi:hypothetical protein